MDNDILFLNMECKEQVNLVETRCDGKFGTIDYIINLNNLAKFLFFNFFLTLSKAFFNAL